MPKFFVDFRPAEVRINSEVYVSYYVLNPSTKRMIRKRIRCNHVHGRNEQIKYAKFVCQEINRKLYSGWNPYKEVAQETAEALFSESVEKYMNEKRKELRPDSIRSYESFTKTLLQYAKRNKIKLLIAFSEENAISLMKTISESARTNKTFNNYIIFYRSLFNYFMKNRLIKENPFLIIDKKKGEEPKTRALIPAEARKQIADYFVETGKTPFLYIMQLCYKCFVRPKEILMLKLENIDFYNEILTIPATVAKNHHAREIAIPHEIMHYFNTIKDTEKAKYIFSKNWLPGFHMLTSRDTGRAWSEMRKKIGLPKNFQFYSLKDTGITEMLETGVPAKFVRDLADHSSIQITEKYVHRAKAKKLLEINKLRF